jgi:hypothetical protein
MTWCLIYKKQRDNFKFQTTKKTLPEHIQADVKTFALFQILALIFLTFDTRNIFKTGSTQ